ncbi:MAG: orotidine-5'-phosphate decarboxylase [Saprospiraceae bacterium]|nr:orotidine-5'-phosphate decarboxylase [Saprospiraceae bacterium]
MQRSLLVSEINRKKSFLCVGLDTDLDKIPSFLHNYEDPIYEFNKRVIDATKDLCVAYKPNIAFYESLGPKGWESLEKTMAYIPENIFTIADAKRGDIGNTSRMYAKTFFEYFNFDSVTVAPYMGIDSVEPFLEFEDKWVILLGLTSNKGSQDFQQLKSDGVPLYESVIRKSQSWGNPGNLMYVIGATHPESFKEIRELAKEYFFLVPGIGAQGGDLDGVVSNGANTECGLLINSSRGIIYAGNGENFAEDVRASALKLQEQLATYL